MAEIKVRTVGDEKGIIQFHVVVCEGSTKTEHVVELSESVYQDLTDGRADPEELVIKSFEFLLEREPKESILTEFDLSVISRYFPEYRNGVKKRFGG